MKRSKLPLVFYPLLMCVMYISSAVQAAAPVVDVALDLSHHNNYSRGYHEGSKQSASVTQITADSYWTKHFNKYSNATLRLGVNYADQNIDNKASYITSRAQLLLNYQPYQNYGRPYFRFSVGYANKNYTIDEFTHTGITTAQFIVGTDVNSRLNVNIGAKITDYHNLYATVVTANHFGLQTQHTAIFADADVQVNGATLYAKAQFEDGDMLATGMHMNGNQILTHWPDAEQQRYNVGINFPIGNASALDILIGYYGTEAQSGLNYSDSFASASFIHRFEL